MSKPKHKPVLLPPAPRSARILSLTGDGLDTADKFARFMTEMMCDLAEELVSPEVGNAITNAGGKVLKVIEMQIKYGTKVDATGEKRLLLRAVPALTPAKKKKDAE
jgi:hypothetical protein